MYPLITTVITAIAAERLREEHERTARIRLVRKIRRDRARYAARRRTSQVVPVMSSAETASSQPPSVSWNCQNRESGWTESSA